jgi:hypothetical protein
MPCKKLMPHKNFAPEELIVRTKRRNFATKDSRKANPGYPKRKRGRQPKGESDTHRCYSTFCKKKERKATQRGRVHPALVTLLSAKRKRGRQPKGGNGGSYKHILSLTISIIYSAKP